MFADGGFMVRSLFRITNNKPFKATMAQQERPITLWCFCLGMESRGVLYSGSSSYSSTTTIIEDKRCPLLGSLFGRGDCSTHEQGFRLIVQLDTTSRPAHTKWSEWQGQVSRGNFG